MFQTIKREDFFKNYFIIKGMVLKNFKGKYGGSFLGLWWTLLEPLLLIVSVGFVFNYVFNVPIKKFPLFLLSSILPWVYLSAVLNDAMVSLVVNAPAVKQFNFNKMIFPFSHVLTSLSSLIGGFFVLIPFFIYFNDVGILQVVVLCFLLLLFVMLTAGLAFILCLTYVFFRDILYIFHSFLMIWFWLTPIFYEVSMIPKKFQVFSYLNPLTAFMQSFRALLYYGKMPDVFDFCVACLYAIFFLLAGCFIFISFNGKIIKKI